MTLTALIVDDEPLARRRVRALLEAERDIVIAGEAANGEEALAMIAELRPQLVLLDVQMPGMNGFEVLQRIEPAERPLVVFVTAFEQYALQAFQVSAVQYLLKPVDRDDFADAIVRVRRIAGGGEGAAEASRAVAELLARLPKPQTFLQRVVVKSRGRTRLFRIDDIDWFESERNYVRIHVGTEHHLLRETMAAIEEKLDPQRFVRIHRTAIVNLDRVVELQPTSHGEYTVLLRGGASLTLSRVYRDRIEPLLGRL